MFLDACSTFERHQHHPEVGVLRERLAVATTAPRVFATQLLDFTTKVDLDIGARHRRRVRASMSWSVGCIIRHPDLRGRRRTPLQIVCPFGARASFAGAGARFSRISRGTLTTHLYRF